MLKIPCAGHLGLFPAISAQFTLECMWQPKIVKNSLNPLMLGVQSHSRSSMLTPLRSLLPVLVIIHSISVPICNRHHTGQANSAKITSFREGASLSPLVRGDPLHPAAGNLVAKYETLSCYHTVKTRSLYLMWAPIGIGL